MKHGLGRVGHDFGRERALGSPFHILDIPLIFADNVRGGAIRERELVRPSIDDRLTAAAAGPASQQIE